MRAGVLLFPGEVSCNLRPHQMFFKGRKWSGWNRERGIRLDKTFCDQMHSREWHMKAERGEMDGHAGSVGPCCPIEELPFWLWWVCSFAGTGRWCFDLHGRALFFCSRLQCSAAGTTRHNCPKGFWPHRVVWGWWFLLGGGYVKKWIGEGGGSVCVGAGASVGSNKPPVCVCLQFHLKVTAAAPLPAL